MQSETCSFGYLEANVLCSGNRVLGVKGLKDVESFCTSLMKVCLDVREYAHTQMKAHAHTHNRTLVTNSFYHRVTGAKSLFGSYLHTIV